MLKIVLSRAFLFLISSIAFFSTLTRTNVARLQPLGPCTTVLPSLMIPIYSTEPALISQTSAVFLVSQDPSLDIFCDCLLNFIIPENSTNCQLGLSFPDGFQSDWGDPLGVYFWNVAEPFETACCWVDAPGITDLFGSVVLQANMTYAIVNSFVCESSVSFRVGMNRSGPASSCSFEQTESEGLVLTYGC